MASHWIWICIFVYVLCSVQVLAYSVDTSRHRRSVCNTVTCPPSSGCVTDSSSQLGYRCVCYPGFIGNPCADRDECSIAANLCHNGTCQNNPGSFKCVCTDGYSGPRCMDDVDECKSSPCLNNNTCVNTPGSYHCSCYVGYKSPDCRDRDECAMVKGLCSNGTCINTPGSFRCRCHTGYAGTHCRQPDPCASSPCQNGGSCMPTEDGLNHTCKCFAGFNSSNNCLDINECSLSLHLCLHGQCTNSPGSFRCRCHAGFAGTHCRQPDPCASSPCQNGGSCMPTEDGLNHTCKCFAGFNSSNNCLDINECSLSLHLCLHGQCTNSPGSFRCRCHAGFAGTHCRQPDPCASSPCKNGGTCMPSEDGLNYTCKCFAGFNSSNNCLDINECSLSSHICLHGQCTNSPGSYKCTCLSGYSGRHCRDNIDSCQSSPCMFNGTCIPEPDGHTCNCPAGFDNTTNCNDIDECGLSQEICHHGFCINLEGSFQCYCNKGYDGPRCNDDKDECLSTPCYNNATCVNTPGSFKCTCPQGFFGDLCKSEVDHCDYRPCIYGYCSNNPISYTCECMEGFTGPDCEEEVIPTFPSSSTPSTTKMSTSSSVASSTPSPSSRSTTASTGSSTQPSTHTEQTSTPSSKKTTPTHTPSTKSSSTYKPSDSSTSTKLSTITNTPSKQVSSSNTQSTSHSTASSKAPSSTQSSTTQTTSTLMPTSSISSPRKVFSTTKSPSISTSTGTTFSTKVTPHTNTSPLSTLFPPDRLTSTTQSRNTPLDNSALRGNEKSWIGGHYWILLVVVGVVFVVIIGLAAFLCRTKKYIRFFNNEYDKGSGKNNHEPSAQLQEETLGFSNSLYESTPIEVRGINNRLYDSGSVGLELGGIKSTDESES